MPATSFVPSEIFDWTRPPPPAAKARTCAPKPKPARKRPRKKPPRITLQVGVRSALQERIEAAIGSRIDLVEDNQPVDRVEITFGELAVFLQVLFPEDWIEVVEALWPTRTAPGSAERIAAYAERARKGQELYHPVDADPVRGDVDGRLVSAGKLALSIVQRGNGTGPKVTGWAEPIG